MQIEELIEKAKAKGIDYLGKTKDNQFLFSDNITVIVNPDNTLTICFNINHVDIKDVLI